MGKSIERILQAKEELDMLNKFFIITNIYKNICELGDTILRSYHAISYLSFNQSYDADIIIFNYKEESWGLKW